MSAFLDAFGRKTDIPYLDLASAYDPLANTPTRPEFVRYWSYNRLWMQEGHGCRSTADGQPPNHPLGDGRLTGIQAALTDFVVDDQMVDEPSL